MAVASTYTVQGTVVARVPGAGTNAVQTLTIGGTPNGGAFKLKHEGFVTAAITWTATDATLVGAVDAALEALPSIGAGNIVAADTTITNGIGDISLTFGGAHAGRVMSLITVAENALLGTAPTVAVVETTPGVNATGIGLPVDAVIVNGVTGLAYKNTGTALNPVWTQI